MAITKDIKKNICDETFAQLAEVKDKIVALRDSLDRKYAGESRFLEVYDRHLSELAEQIEWKLQIIAHSCPYDWKGSDEFTETVSVGPADKSEEDFSPGYVGG